MAFFYNEAKTEKPKKPRAVNRKTIPIASLQRLGCSVCPRDKDEDLHSPKMEPEGTGAPYIYLLGSGPSREDDAEDMHWCDEAGEAIYKKFGKEWMKEYVRSNYITQCKGEESPAAIECCRPRIVADIERTRPLVIVGIGDEVLRWATGISPASTLTHRGTLFAVKIGAHTCWYYPILYPNFVFKKGNRKSEYETVLEHDVRWIKRFVSGPEYRKPWVAEKPYDAGIEIITGNEPGDMQRLEAALERLAKKAKSALDIETSGLRVYMQKSPLLICAAVGVHEDVVAFSIDHPEGWGTQAQRERVHKLFARYLIESGTKFCHNLAMEMEWTSFFYGNEVLRLSQWGDTMAMGHSLDERKGSKSLNTQVIRRFGFDLKAQSRIDVSRPQWWLQYPLKEILRYNGLDTKWTDALRADLAPEVEAVEAYIYEYERKVRTASTLVIMENLGMPVDLRYAKEMCDKLLDDLDGIEAKIKRCPEVQKYKERLGTFQPTNPEQVLKLLRDICKREEIEVRDRDGKKTGESTDEEHLSAIPANEVPSAALILEHRGVSKLLSTYIEPIIRKDIVCVDGLLRSKYGSMEAETGRFNSEDPNIQNWPKRKHKEVRGIIAANALGPGQKMVACDYGQIEFRVVGMASEDPNLIKYCWTGYDVHKYWAERMVKEYPQIKDRIVEEFHIDWDKDGLKTLRQDAKNMWVFPQLFGSSVRSCADNLRIPYEIMEDLAAEFWDVFRKAKEWQERLLESYAKKGYVETLDGRRRRGAMTLNQIINHPIQGTALSIVCAGMNALSERAECEERWDCHPRFNGHDDLSFFMDESRIQANTAVIVEEMCKPRFDFVIVPLIVEVSVGDRWNEMKEIQKVSSEKLFNLRNPYA